MGGFRPDEGAVRYRIKHAWLGYFVSIKRTEWDSFKYSERWTSELPLAEPAKYTLEELRRPMDANGNGLLSILVSGYTGLKLEIVEPVEKLKLRVA